MAWSVLQSANGTSADATSITATFSTANLSAGTKIIAYATSSNAASSPAISSVTATGSNTLTQIGSASQGNARTYIYAVDSSGSGGTTMVGTKPTITATWASAGGLSLIIQEVSGLLPGNTTAMIDGTAATLTGTSASTGSPSYSSTATNEFLVACYGDNGNSATVSLAGGWTAETHNQNTSGFSNCMVQYKNSTGGSETDGYTGADTAGWAIVEVAFLLAGGGAPSPPLIPPGRMSPMAFQFFTTPFPYDTGTVSTVNGTVPPHLVIASRATARAVWKGFVSATTNLMNGNPPDGVVYRRTSARAVVRGNPVPPRTGIPVTGRGSVARRTSVRAFWRPTDTTTTNLLSGNFPDGVIYRRKAARAVWRGYVSATTNLLNGNQPDGVVYRRKTARAVVHGNPAPFPPPSGTVPAHLVVAHRAAARGVWRGFISSTTNLLNGNQPGSGLVKRRASSRAVWRGFVSSTTNQVFSGGNGTVPLHLVVARRQAARAVWRGFTSSTTNLLAGNQPGGKVYRRAPARAVWRGGAVSPAVPKVASGRLVARRVPARVVWAGTVSRTVNTVPTVSGVPPLHLVVAHRAAARAVVRGTVVTTVNQVQQGTVGLPRLVVPRRVPSRAVIRGNPVPGVFGVPVSDGLVKRRNTARVVWRGVTVRTVNALPVAVAAPRERLVVPRRMTSRAVWRGFVSSTQNHLVVSAAAFSLGQPFTGWSAGIPSTQWGIGQPDVRWAAGIPFTVWEAGEPFTAWETGLVFIR